MVKKMMMLLLAAVLMTGMIPASVQAASVASQGTADTDEAVILDPSTTLHEIEVRVPDEKTVTVTVGTIIDIVADDAKTYKSSNSTVAAVSASGVVTTKKDGTVKITVTLNNKKKQELTIVIVDPTKATSITLDYEGTIYMVPGQEIMVEADMAPATATSTITWKSSSKKVVSLANTTGEFCTITAKEKGLTVITAMTATKKKDTFKIRVVPNKIDNLHTKPSSTYIKSQYPGGWDMELKSMEILADDKVVVECYLVNGTGATLSKLTNVVAQIYYGDEVIVDAAIPSKTVSCKKYASKILKLTFSGDEVDFTNLDFTKFSEDDRYEFDEYWDGYAVLK